MRRLYRGALAAVLVGVQFSTPTMNFALSDDDGAIRHIEDDFVLAVEDEEAADENEDDAETSSVSWLLQPPIQPAAPEITEFGLASPASPASISQSVFSSSSERRSLVTQSRRATPFGGGSELVFGAEGRFRVTTDGGNLLGKSLFAPSVKVQQRTPVVTDPRVRGARAGRLLASGSYWAPARQDLDTLMSKIDSRIIGDVVVVKGPYSVRYGPGTNFIDFRLLESPRYDGGSERHGMTSFEYKANGEQIYGRDMVWGGGENYGYRVGYGHRTGNDYRDGSGFRLPTSYNSRDFDVALGYDFSDLSHLEFNYLRQDQTGMEFPGLVFDINALMTDGFELRYALEDQPAFDLLTVEGWYNRTRFTGDTSRSGKTRQIPTVNFNEQLVSAPGVVPTMPGQFLLTNVDGMSAGYRAAMSWGDIEDEQLTIGTDMIRQGTQLNDIAPAHTVTLPPPLPFLPPIVVPVPTRNFPIPRSRSMDIGLFADHTKYLNDSLSVTVGSRVDMVSTDAENMVTDLVRAAPGGGFAPTTISAIKQAGLNQHFTPWAVYATADYDVNTSWTITASAGHSVRPPDLTELYATGSFIGTIQPGLTFIEGDPEIDPERHTQIDLGTSVDLGSLRMNASGFFAWVNDYIVYDVIDPKVGLPPVPGDPFVPGTDNLGLALGNTDLATLTGFEFMAEQDLRNWVTAFAVVSYLEGRDHTRNKPTRLGAVIRGNTPGLSAASPRSFVAGTDDQPLPSIPPLEARLGFRFHDPDCDHWGWEIEARVVNQQNRVASSLFEMPTPGFTAWNLRGYWRAFSDLTLIGGIENFTDNRYREHLDYRAGLGVFRPGINFYTAAELTY